MTKSNLVLKEERRNENLRKQIYNYQSTTIQEFLMWGHKARLHVVYMYGLFPQLSLYLLIRFELQKAFLFRIVKLWFPLLRIHLPKYLYVSVCIKKKGWNQENKSSGKIRKFFRINNNGLIGDLDHTKVHNKTKIISNGS